MTSTKDIFNQAEAHVRAGRLDVAIQAYRSILERDPGDTRAKYRIAVINLMRNEFGPGEALLRECLADRPEDPDILFSLGRACSAQGKHDDATAALTRAVRIAGDRPDLHAALADALFLAGRSSEALQAYEAAVTLAPDDARVRVNMASVLSRLGEHAQAIDAAEIARRSAPDRPDIALAHANTLRVAGRLDDALGIVETLLERAPTAVPLLACKAEILDRQGDSSRAAELLAPLIETRPVPVALARACGQIAVNADQTILDAAAVNELIERGLQQPGLNPYDRRGLLFLQANLLDRIGDTSAAFDACLRANAEAGLAYDARSVDARLAGFRRVFAPDRLPTLARSSNNSTRPLFIVGMPRSGTTLVKQILDSHPDVAGAGELDDIPNAARRVTDYPQGNRDLTSDELDDTAAAYLETLDGVAPRTRYVVDKMPINFEHLGLVWQLFPGARIIHCRRHPLGVGLSCLFQNFRNSNAFAFSMDAFAHYYRHYEASMAHWSATLDLPMFELRYEELVADPEAGIAALLAFCDLPWDDACLAFDRNRRFINTLSYAQVRKPINTAAGGRHRRYADELAPLARDLADEIERYETGSTDN